MDPTTLVTFLFRAPPEVRTVELLGSWDNFALPYRMHHDRRRGPNFWSGCFKFDNIIFDGQDFQWTKPRTGGLKQGGTYWYYYRLNYDLDAFDEHQPYTTGCPLLPGQAVNVIEVPRELVEMPTRCHSADGNDITGSLANLAERKTLDPADKYAAVSPPPISKVHSRCLSDDQLAGRLKGRPSIRGDQPVSPISPQKLRQARAVSPISRDSRVSVRVRPHSSAVSSIHSLHSYHGVPPTAVSAISEMSVPIEQEEKAFHPPEVTNPHLFLEHLGMPSAAPLGSSKALSACLFNSTSSHSSPSDTIGNCQPTGSRRRDSTFSCGPASIHNVQFYGSRPNTGPDNEHETYRPPTYSIPPSSVSDDSPAQSPSSSTFPTTVNHEYADRIRMKLEDDGIPDEDLAALELASPTFTASTVSTAGNNAPFRLSAQSSCDERPPEHDSVAFEQSIKETASSHQGRTSSARPSFLVRGLARLRPTFGLNYSLPSISSDSSQSLAKTITKISQEERATSPSSSSPSSLSTTSSPPLPSIIREEEGSMADAIFHELEFLRVSNT